ncbi:hypothetical protein OHA40_20810 [Nocardia sp. NBC_00508]|uniref:hypothetical protein n=1 Tax=Nocardia sp. NBC_00508 TaxID=2975992 RepID=UPI002E7FF30F|nr:hypothetical protein [Nocardia sp. NBC_00508]WUD64152.1 hypothetical protein OHA40_20810 [Nocardia sp. NBC_00508]
MTADMNYQHGWPGAAPGSYPPAHPHLPGPGYQPPRSSAGGGTGIAAGLLALLGGGWEVFGLVSMGTTFGTLAGLSLISVAVAGFVAFLLILGGVLLLCRLTVGRVLVIVGSALSLINMAVGLAMVGLFGLLPIILGVLTLATLVLAALSPTGRWIAARRQSVPMYGHQPAPPYGQPSYSQYGHQPPQPFGYPTAPPPGYPAPSSGQPPYPNS